MLSGATTDAGKEEEVTIYQVHGLRENAQCCPARRRLGRSSPIAGSGGERWCRKDHDERPPTAGKHLDGPVLLLLVHRQ